MKWTAAGKKVGDKVAMYKDRWSRVVVLVEITGETKTQWLIPNHRVRKADGLLIGSCGHGWSLRAYDADDETIGVAEKQKHDLLMIDRRDLISRWVLSVPAGDVVELLWPIVGPLVEGASA